MTPFITMHLSLNPSPEEMRKARELLAFWRSLCGGKVEGEPDGDDAPIITAPEIAARLGNAPHPDTAFQALVPPPHGNPPAHDSKGLPWDERIHSSTKGQNQDGSWKKRRNVDDATVASVEAALRGGVAPPPPPPALAAAPPPPPPPTAGTGRNFQEIMKRFAEGVREKKYPPTTALDMAKAVGVDQPVQVNANPALWPRADAYLTARETGVDHETAVAMLP